MSAALKKTVPAVKRLNQWDWQGRVMPDAKVCAQRTEQGKPSNHGDCGNVAKYEIDGTPMCRRHASSYVLRALDTEAEANG